MLLSLSAPPATRLRQLLVLLLLALGLLAGVSVSQSRDVEAQVVAQAAVVLPTLQQARLLAGQIDDQRGMAALHLTLRDDAERGALEDRLQASRQQVERRMQGQARRLQNDADRRHHAAVKASLAAFWTTQDRLLAASRQSTQDPAAAALARQLLTGEAQQAYERLRADLEAWWTATEQAAAQAAGDAVALAQRITLLVWAQGALVALALAVAWALLHLPARPLPPPPTDPLDSGAARQHLQVLNAAVATARRGEPGRAAGLSALEARHLAEQVDGAARGLRRLIDRPAAGAATAPAAGADSPADPPDSPPAR